MRLHAYPSHPDYRPEVKRATVLLDGRKVERCVAADEELGFVRVIKTGSDGRPLVDRARDQVITECLPGYVEIIIARS